MTNNIHTIINDLNELRTNGFWDHTPEFQNVFNRLRRKAEQHKDTAMAPLLGQLVDVQGILVDEGFGKCGNLNRLSIRVLVTDSTGRTFEVQHLHIYDEVVQMGTVLSKSTKQFSVKGARVYRYQRKNGTYSYSVEDPNNPSLINGRVNRTQR